MVSNVSVSAYARIARMTSNINGYLRQAMVTKSQATRESMLSLLNSQGIARNVNITA